MTLAVLLAVLSSTEAVLTILNSAASTSPARFAEAQALVAREAAAGKPLQQFVLGITAKDKDVAERNLAASRDKIRTLAEKNNNSLAWYLLSVEKNDRDLLRRAAEGGNVQALNALGTISTQEALDGKLEKAQLEAVLKTSFNYFKKAAERRDPNGFVNLGTCYLRGFGCDIDKPLAFECFRSAAELGHPEAMDYVSASYEHGNGVRKDAARALYWCMKAKAYRGDKAAAEWLKGSVCPN